MVVVGIYSGSPVTVCYCDTGSCQPRAQTTVRLPLSRCYPLSHKLFNTFTLSLFVL